MRIRNLVLVMIVLIAAGTLAMAAGTGNPDAGRPEDAGPDGPIIKIENNTVIFNFFSPDNTDTWEINVSWEEGHSHADQVLRNESYNGTIVYSSASRSYSVEFFTESSEDGGDNIYIIDDLPYYGLLVYDIRATAYNADGEEIAEKAGILDLNSLIQT